MEHSDLEDKSSDIMFKGVVFNEMKGALVCLKKLSFTIVILCGCKDDFVLGIIVIMCSKLQSCIKFDLE